MTPITETLNEAQGRTPGPFGAPMDMLARDRGGWTDSQMVYAVEVIGRGPDPQVMLTGSEAKWLPRAKRWSFTGFPPVKAAIFLSEYKAALAKATGGTHE